MPSAAPSPLPSAAPAVEVIALRKEYPGTIALDGLSLAFEAGRISALIGKNGAGKSTLVRILSGAAAPTHGELRLFGKRLELRSPAEALRAGIATVHQELSLMPGLTVGENVLIGRYPRRRGWMRPSIDWQALHARAADILGGMGVKIDSRARLARLSLAQRQMVEIARAVSFESRVILLDEPTAGLARAEVNSLFDLMRTLARRGAALVYVTHRLSEIGEIADTVAVLRDGRCEGSMVAAHATPEIMATAMFGNAPRTGAAEAPDHPQERSAPQLLEVRDLCLSGRLVNVGLALHRGEVLGIAGSLGSGRTELLECLFGARRPDRGSLVIHDSGTGSAAVRSAAQRDGDPPPAERSRVRGGEPPMGRHGSPGRGGSERARPITVDLTRATPAGMKRLGLALVPEDRSTLGLVMGLPVLDNAALASLGRISLAGILSRRRVLTTLAPLLDNLSVRAPSLSSPVSALSGGNQQKIVIAKWLNNRPRVVLYDEPTRGIDGEARGQIFDIIRSRRREGVAAIVVSSDLEDLPAICDRILIMKRGSIVEEHPGASLSAEELYSRCS
jgi:ABC-type sugar transport system ATPase subunit